MLAKVAPLDHELELVRAYTVANRVKCSADMRQGPTAELGTCERWFLLLAAMDKPVERLNTLAAIATFECGALD